MGKEALSAVKKKTLKSKSISGSVTEATYQVAYDKSIDELMNELKIGIKVKSVNLVAYTNDIGM